MKDSRFCAGERTGEGGWEVEAAAGVGEAVAVAGAGDGDEETAAGGDEGGEARVGVPAACSRVVVVGDSPFPSDEVVE